VYGYIQSSTPEARKADRYIIPITNIPFSELRLRPELSALLTHVNLKPSDLITLDDLGEIQDRLPAEKTSWTLVDHNVFQGELGRHYSNRVTGVIDHHTDEEKVPKEAYPRVIEKTGSCSSHVVEYCKDAWESISRSDSTESAGGSGEDERSELDAQVAKIALAPILIDTVNLKASDKVTDHDRNAITYVESKISASSVMGANYNRDAFFKEINDAKSNLDDLSLEEILRKDYKQWREGDLTVGISALPRPIKYLQSKTDDFVSTLVDFAKGRGVQLFAVMTAHNDSGQFERQLLLLTIEDGEPSRIANKFVETTRNELELTENSAELDGSNATWLKFWEQKNLTASRKRVAPMIREVMR
jgi:exopolyphosphatase